ncbi:MAG: tetratricopeptide repeat protein [Scytolyngbya sp. HA4215-MV1]|nr:tetratricopeptide repeat protein [Scytolyngbya sp. HA4215-MV1]
MKGFEDRLNLFLLDDGAVKQSRQVTDQSSSKKLAWMTDPKNNNFPIAQRSSMVQENIIPVDLNACYSTQELDMGLSVSQSASELAQLLNLFATAPIDWQLVEIASAQLHWAQEQVDDARTQLLDCKFLHLIDIGLYQIAPVLREIPWQNLSGSQQQDCLNAAFAEATVLFTKQLTQPLSSTQSQAIAVAVPHIIEVVQTYTQYLEAVDLNYLFTALGNFYTENQQFSTAESWYQQGQVLLQSRLGGDHPQVAISLNNLASFYQAQQRYSEAEPLFIQALAINQRSRSNSPELATSLNNLAGFYKVQGDYSKAEALYLQALDLKLHLFGEAHPSVATGLNNLAGIYYAQGCYGEAETLYLRALQLKKSLVGANHPGLAISLNNLASVYQAQQRYGDAKQLYERAVQLSTQNFGKDHPTTLTFQRNLNKICEMQATEADSPKSKLANTSAWKMVNGMRGLLGLNF